MTFAPTRDSVEYPATTRQFWEFFAAVTGTPPHGIYESWCPEFTAEPLCRCHHSLHTHRPDPINPHRPCGHSYCPCWRFRPLIEPEIAPFLPGMEIVDHACPVPAKIGRTPR